MRHGFQLSVGVNPDGVGKANAAFAGFADAYALPVGVRRTVNVALDELLANELSHGMVGRHAGSVTIAMELDQERVTVTLSSDGPPFDPFGQAAPDTTLPVNERPVGGLGLHLVRELMDEVRYERRNGQNVVVLVKLLAVG
jgi:anti-sigma regulatory factor (Ser/Thr protein kinase)